MRNTVRLLALFLFLFVIVFGTNILCNLLIQHQVISMSDGETVFTVAFVGSFWTFIYGMFNISEEN